MSNSEISIFRRIFPTATTKVIAASIFPAVFGALKLVSFYSPLLEPISPVAIIVIKTIAVLLTLLIWMFILICVLLYYMSKMKHRAFIHHDYIKNIPKGYKLVKK